MRICLKFSEALLIISRRNPVANFRVTGELVKLACFHLQMHYSTKYIASYTSICFLHTGIEAEMKDTAEETTISAW